MNKNEFLNNFKYDLIHSNINFALPTVSWSDKVGNITVEYLSSVSSDKRVSKSDLFMEMGDIIKDTLCHGDSFGVEMCLSKATDYMFWMYFQNMLGKKDKEKMEKLMERA